MTATVETERREIDRSTHTTTQQQELDHFIALANEARRDYETAAKEYRDLVHLEGELEAQRTVLRELLKQRLMQDQKLAATNAERESSTQPEYLNHLINQRDTVRRKDDARTRMVSAVLRCKTCIAAVKAIGGWI